MPAITTTPKFLEMLSGKHRDLASRVIMCDPDSEDHSFSADDALRRYNIHKIYSKTGVELVNISTLPATYVEGTIQGKKGGIQVSEILMKDIDSNVSVPVQKVHAMTIITLILKNFLGFLFTYNEKFPSKTYRAYINTSDGDVAKIDFRITANNHFFAGILGTMVTGFRKFHFIHYRFADKKGLGVKSLGNLGLNQKWKMFQMNFLVKRTHISSLSTLRINYVGMAKIVMECPVRPFLYEITTNYQNKDEDIVNLIF